MRRRRAFILSLAGVALAGVGVLLALRASRPAVAGSRAAESTRAATPSQAPAPSALASAAGEPAPLASSAAAAPSAATTAAKSAPRVDPARRQQADRIRERLRADRAAGRPRTRRTEARSGSARAEAPAFDHMPALEGEGNQAERPLGVYVRNTVREQLIPLATGCYEALLERAPDARGTIVLELSIVGDADVGGVVEQVDLGEGTSLSDAELASCVTESLYATVFDAPPQGEERVTVTYPIALEP